MNRTAQRQLAAAAILLAGSTACFSAPAEYVRLPAVFTDHMVLQRDMPVAVWGWASPGGKVSVSIDGRAVAARAREDSTWSVSIPAMEAGGPHTLVVTGNDTIALSDVLVGEVWIASGQSNMEWPVARSRDSVVEANAADYPSMRIFRVAHGVSYRPQADAQADGWSPISPQSILPFSAVGYFFGRTLHQDLDVPIGLIQTTWGGTPAEAWTSAAGLQSMPDFEEHVSAVAARAAGGEAPSALEGIGASDRPIPPQRQATTLFNAMVAPLVPFTMRGVIWYQGEANAGRAYQYRTLFPAMIEDWRHHWGDRSFPFLFVQLANFQSAQQNPVEPETWPELREAQSLTLALPNTAQAVTIDIGEADDIHPRNKQDVGLRLALAALNTVYGRDVVYSGPAYRDMTVEGGTIRLHFEHVGGGLMAPDGELNGFAIAGENREFVWAHALIAGETVVVSSPDVAAPVAVRYAWANNPVISLYNREGLPASPFRTDDWPGVTVEAR